MAGMTQTTDQPRKLSEPLDYATANFITLLLAVIILIAFIFMPWLWTGAKYNGARIMSDVLAGGMLRTYGTNAIVLIPIVGLLVGGLAVWGLLNTHRSALASLLAAGVALIGLYYYYDVYYVQEGQVAEYVRVNLGTGSKVVLVALVALLAQTVILLPAINRAVRRLNSAIAAVTPSVPQGAVPYLFLAAPMLLYLVWIIGPTLYTFYLSLTNWDGVSAPHYIGLKNYRILFNQNTFTEALGNNVRWLVVFVTVPTTMGLGLAMIFNTEMRGGRWYKVSFYSPLVLSWPVIALVWSWVYHPARGLINSLLIQGHITQNPPGWLADRSLAIYCIIAAATWRQVGYVMVLYLAGLKNVDPTLLDAGLVDGANRWQLFRHVIFPLLAPVTTIVFIISVIDSLRSFDLVQVMTRGHQSTQVLANYMYIEAFNNYRMGFGAAIAVILFTISIFFVGIYLWRSLKTELEY
jgi:ABC-type sugar transport system permease subunit